MKKKITLILLICFLLISCGKKSDPEYKDSKIKTKIQSIFITLV